MRKNIHIYPSPFQHESRIFKETRSLITHQIVDKIIMVGIEDKRLQEYEALDEFRYIWRVPLTNFPLLKNKKIRRILHYLEWILKIILFAWREKPDMVNCHSIFDLPIGVILKFSVKCILIYDTHELETERNGLKGPLKRLAKIIESLSISYVNYLFVVSDSIAEWYQTTYKIHHVAVVKNVPYAHQPHHTKQTPSIFRHIFNIPENHLLFIYQGALMEGRGIHLLLSVFSKVQQQHIIFMGYGVLEDTIRQYEQQYSTIHFHAAVPPESVLEYTREADVGISIIENVCLSYYFCLPNKIFEYLFSGIPCIVSNFPDMAAMIEHYRCGWTTDVNKEAISALINSLTRDDVKKIQQSISIAQKTIGWHFEETKLIEAYKSLDI
ncbi:MAG: glycosyltransferase [Candidatus Vecturithrix sp.]|jgi:glycosyltransferase involved in cell wall biosynthesis|nr:glycosyltransferase [Candidatus Vecturithrix sp.]